MTVLASFPGELFALPLLPPQAATTRRVARRTEPNRATPLRRPAEIPLTAIVSPFRFHVGTQSDDRRLVTDGHQSPSRLWAPLTAGKRNRGVGAAQIRAQRTGARAVSRTIFSGVELGPAGGEASGRSLRVALEPPERPASLLVDGHQIAVGEQEAKVGAYQETTLTPPAVLQPPHLFDPFDRTPVPSPLVAQRRRPAFLKAQLDRRRLVQQS